MKLIDADKLLNICGDIIREACNSGDAPFTLEEVSRPLGVTTSGERPRKTVASSAVMRLTVVKQSASRADAVSIEHLAVML